MRSLSTLVVSIAAAGVLVACSSADPSPDVGGQTSTTTTAADPTQDIAAVAATMAQTLNAGCGAAPKPTCESADEHLRSFARQLRRLMDDSGDRSYYREGILLADRVITAESTEPLRTAAIELLAWLDANPA